MTQLPLRCNCRKHAVTTLRCARCSAPICPDCSIVVPTGMVCRECSGRRNSPLHKVPKERLALALLLTPLACVLGGLALLFGFPMGFFGLWLAFIYGIGAGEVTLRITGYKRGPIVESLAGGSAVFGILAAFLIRFAPRIPLYMLPGFFFSNTWFLIALVISAYMAVMRIRNI